MARDKRTKMTAEGLEKTLDTFLLPEIDTKTRDREEIRHPRKWAVIFVNDDFTPMDFVVDALTKHFNKSVEESIGIMLETHHDGEGLVGLFSREIAEHRSELVMALARDLDYPLMLRIEPIEGDEGE